jgi:hypothetical protein
MKLELLASVLGKDATELAGTLNLQENQSEVAEDVLKDVLSKHIKEIEVNAKLTGKREAEGMAKRTILTDAEKKLKTTFDVDGKDFDELLNNLNSKFESLSKSGTKDEDLKKQVDTWKTTVKELQLKLDSKDKEFENIRTKEVVKSKITPVLGKFEFATDKVQEIALNQFLEKNQFKVDGEDLFLEKNGAYFSNIIEAAEIHFKDFGKVKEVNRNAPPNRTGDTNYGTTLKDLLTQVEKAKTTEERQSIMNQIQSLEKV